MTVREEAVRLSLEDAGFSTGIAKDAAAVALLKRELDGLPGSASKSSQATKSASQEADNLARSAENGSKSIDKFSGRLGLLVSAATALGPALVPIGAVGIPAIAGLASEVGFLALGVGTTMLAFEGLGKALTAFNKASLQPTAANIAAAQLAMDKLSPSAQQFVLELHKIGPELTSLQQAAGEGLFPGLTSGLHSLVDDSPLVKTALRGIGSELGSLADRAGGALSNNEWQSFLKHVGQEAPIELGKLGQATGDVTHGLMELFLAFDPMNQNFSSGVVALADDFDRWATSLGKTKGFQDFIVYVQTNGPRVIQLLGDTASLFVDIVKAAAPLGGPTIHALDLIVKALDAIASSPLGTPLIALAQINAILKLTTRGLAAVGVESRLAFGGGSSLALGGNLTKLKGSLGESSKALFNYYSAEERATAKAGELEEKTSAVRSQFATGAVAAAAFGLATSGVADSMGLADTASLAMAGSLAGPVGIGVGAAVGLLMDMANAAKNDAAQIDAMHESVSKLASSNNVMALGKVAEQADALNQKFGNLGGGGIFGVLGTSLGAKLSIPGSAFSSVSSALNQFNQGLTGSSDPVTKLTQLQAVADRMQPAMSKLGLTLDDLVNLPKDQLPSVVAHLVAITQRSEQTIGSTKAVTQAFAAMSDESLTAADRVTMLTTALDNLLDPMLNLGAAHDAFTKGLNDISSSLSKNSKTLVGNSDAAIQNRDAIRGQVTNLKGWIEAQAKANVPVSKMTADLKAGRQAIIDQGTAAGLNKQQIQSMIDTMHLTPKLIQTAIELAGADKATGQIQFINSQLEGLNGRVFSATIRVTREGAALDATGGRTVQGRADGGYISGPGGPTSDSILARLSNGEYVMRAAAVAKYGRAMFDRLNRFSDGGPVDPHLKHPLFTHEGPHWYHAAYKHNHRFARKGPAHWDWPYQSSLHSEKQAREFQRWVTDKHVPFDTGARITDYDMRGYWLKTKGRGWHKGSHFPDTFKTPYDTTFSHESKYATKNNPFYWHGNKLVDERNGQVIFAASGGSISGPGGPEDDMIPAWLSNGEYVMNAKAVAKYGTAMFDHMNAAGFANGGLASAGVTAGGLVGAAGNSLRDLKHSLDEATKSLDNEKQHRDALVSAEKQMASSIATSLRSDLFAQTSIWGQGGSVGSVLGGDLRNDRAFNKALHMLVRKGVSGGLLAEAAQSGNLQGVQQFAGESRQQIARDERLYRERQRLTAGIGQNFAGQRYGAQLGEANKHLIGLRDDVHRLTAQVKHLEHAQHNHPERTAAGVGKQINDASSNAVRKRRHR